MQANDEIEQFVKVKTTEKFLFSLFDRLKVLDQRLDENPQHKDRVEREFEIGDLNRVKPEIFGANFSLDRKLIIRNCSNLDLQTGST